MRRRSPARWALGILFGSLVSGGGAMLSTYFLRFLPERREPLNELAAGACIILGLLAGFWAFRRIWPAQLRIAAPGFCRHCDYDLTGNTSGVCPECGTKVTRAES